MPPFGKACRAVRTDPHCSRTSYAYRSKPTTPRRRCCCGHQHGSLSPPRLPGPEPGHATWRQSSPLWLHFFCSERPCPSDFPRHQTEASAGPAAREQIHRSTSCRAPTTGGRKLCPPKLGDEGIGACSSAVGGATCPRAAQAPATIPAPAPPPAFP